MLQLHNIKKSYCTFDFVQTALDDVSIAFRDNEFAAVLGPSGSGKTTMLNIIGGLDRYDEGDLEIDHISTKKYKDRDWDTYRNNRVGFVFQSYNLIPHQSVLANVELALTLSGVSATERHARAKLALEEVGLGEHIRKKPSQLSGGQMQRVAIARALINDPEILLADEPTGALDTTTSKQVMELLTRIAKDRLVIMVTHNSELAEQYANRLVHLQDGKITSDSRPFDPAAEAGRTGRETRKASMSFLTAIALSFSNLMTKKGRTFMTALAGSIGIIGIATILGLSTGINAYIKNVEEETLSLYPLTISGTGFDLSSMFDPSDRGERGEADEPDESKPVRERRIVESIFSLRSKNDLASLKAYLDGDEQGLESYVSAIHYMYDITPQIYLADTKSSTPPQVHPDSILSAYGMGAGGMGMGMSFGMGGMTVFHEMPGDLKLYENQYDVMAGRWPQSYNEAVLVLSAGGRITDYSLYTMGLRDRSELKAMIDAFMNPTEEEDVEIQKEGGRYSYEELMAVSFAVVNPADRYQYDETYNIWVDKSGDKIFMRSLVHRSERLKIVGVVQPNPDATATSLSTGINYSSDLITHLMEQAALSPIIQDQLENPAVNVLTGRTFLEEQENPKSTFDFSKIISVDEEIFKEVLSIDPSAIRINPGAFNIDPGAFQIDLSGFALDLSNIADTPIDLTQFKLPDVDLGALISAVAAEARISPREVTDIMRKVLRDFFAEQQASEEPLNVQQTLSDFSAYLARSDVQAGITAQFSSLIDPSAIQDQILKALGNFVQAALKQYMAQMMESVQAEIQAQIQLAMMGVMAQMQESMAGIAGPLQRAMRNAMGQLATQLQNIDGARLAEAFQINMGEEEILELMTTIMNPGENSYERNLAILGYVSPDTPSSINIYPRSFEAKQEVINVLNRYNERMEEEGAEDKVVRYTDFVGVLMSSVTEIVGFVSAGLIAFVAISLIVSSIMIGVITLISVLERKKEIGILRAIGASKQNIRLVFNAETLIIGFVAGLLGVVVSSFICIVGSAIVYNRFGFANIAQLPVNAAVILVGVSMFLTFIAGLFPASAAARKDPVVALRSE